jgi:proteasome lid subunit RPN8/RPN11
MSAVTCPKSLIEQTIEQLRRAGSDGNERVVLWLAKRGEMRDSAIVEIFVPQQCTAEDYFYIPPEGMKSLMTYLRTKQLSLRSQVHSHPRAAFHSKADDKWAIVRQEGALSLVLPYFAQGVTTENFFERCVIFRLDAEDRWVPVPSTTARDLVIIT